MFHRPDPEYGMSLGIKRTLTYVFQLEVSPSGLAPTIPWGPRGLWAHAGHCRALWALQTSWVRGVVAPLAGEPLFRIPTLKCQAFLPCGACLRRSGTLKTM